MQIKPTTHHRQRIEVEQAKSPVDYAQALARMEDRAAKIREGTAHPLLWFLEHPPLYTAGTSAREEDLLEGERFPVYPAGRGGEYTYHGPGQRIVYTMLDLSRRKEGRQNDIRGFVCDLEHWIIDTLAEFGIIGERRDGRIGVWVVKPDGTEAKIAAIGIRIRRWVSFHGIALNVNPDLTHFNGIVPCGIRDYGVTSLADLGMDISMEEVDQALRRNFLTVFDEYHLADVPATSLAHDKPAITPI